MCTHYLKKGIVVLFLIVSTVVLSTNLLYAQVPNPNEAEWVGDGYALKKIVSNTTIASGVNFSYTLMFSAPAGATTVTIADQIPIDVEVVNVPTPADVNGVTPTVSITGTPGVNEEVTYSLTGLPGGSASSGSFTIVVKFPEGVTCDGTSVRNRAGILVDDKWNYTPFVSTTATAVDPWKVAKTIVGGAVVNPSGGSCGYMIAPDGTVTYRLYVMKSSPYYGNVNGQMNMTGATVTDVLPPGAVVTSSTCSGIPIGSSGTITWNVNSGSLDATTPYAYYYCEIEVQYPVGSFPIGSIINNELTLDGEICNQNVSHTSNQTCVEVIDYTPNENANFQKYISLANRVPGCTGMYRIIFCNNGNVPLSAFNIDDAIPSGVSVDEINIYNANATTTVDLNINGSSYATGINSTYSTGTIGTTVNDIQLQMTGSLPVGDCIYMYVEFTVNPNPTGTVVTNCASFDGLANSLSLDDACVSFTVEAGEPRPCIVKDICSPQTDYEPGDIVRFRLRVQNIGSADLSGATIQDVLNSNFSYVGNETYYVASTYSPACSSGGGIPSGASAWTGVNPTHSGNNLNWIIPDVPADCQLFYSSYCGTYGTYTLPYYFIEFDVQVDDFALPGVTVNNFDISGGNLTSNETSNDVNVLVVASLGQEVEKEVSTDGGTTFASSGAVSPGGTARYRLNYTNTSNVQVSSINLVDLLPLDDTSPDDWLILDRNTPRGSTFGVDYANNHSSALVPGAPFTGPTPTYSNDLNVCLPMFSYSPAGCNGPTFGSTPERNIFIDYTSLLLAPTVKLQEEFDVTIPSGATSQQTACNDFAAISSTEFLLDGTPQFVTLTPIAAPPVCLTIDTAAQSSCCDSIIIEAVSNPATGEDCCVRITAECPVKSVELSVENGTISSAISSCSTLPTGYAGQSNFTFPGNGCEIDMTHCFTTDQAGSITVNYVITFDSGETCTDSITVDCGDVSVNCCDSITLESYQDPDLGECCVRVLTECEIDSVLVTVNNGVFSSNTWNCSTTIPAAAIGQSSYMFDAASCVLNMTNCVTATQSGTVSLTYVFFFANGEKCEKDIEMDCEYTAQNCCDSITLETYHDPDLEECCVKVTADCEVDSVMVAVDNGVFSSNSWNCSTPIPNDAVGQSSYTFNSASCVLDMNNCFTVDQAGVLTVTYVFFMANGEKCEKKVQLDCAYVAEDCCDNVELLAYQDADLGECCAQFISKCETDSIAVMINNGTFANVTLNGISVSTGVIGQSSYTFNTTVSAVDLITCVTPDTTGVVVLNYVAYFANGEVCEKRIELDCKAQEPTSDCCPIVDFKLRRSWPFFNKYVGTFEISNPDPSNPICSVQISSSPGGSFNTGTLIIDGAASGQSWNSSSIPASGTLSPQAVEDMLFTLTAFNYTGVVTVCVTKCDGSECCYEFNWNGKPIVVIPWEPAQLGVGGKLVAVSVSPEMIENLDESIKYVSFGFADEQDLGGEAEFFAIGGTGDCDDTRAEATPGSIDPDSDDDGISDGTESYMSKHNAFFELTCPYEPGSGVQAPIFNLVLKGELPKLGMALISEDGNVVFDGEIDLANPDSVITSVGNLGDVSGKMFEFINLYPNPSDGDFTVKYATGEAMDIDILIVNQLGQIVEVQNQGRVSVGVHNTTISAAGLPAGVYKAVLKSGNRTLTKSAILK
ncbi:T9SS type A sorting domain-containing protein [Draconibacterium halophilum]|uniref:T9SS type A sorting domain-containing protein n=1 Tax=Draconibacterium halophilum TaxID=2706887 RepID=A0A6C0RGD0_9BACT|nr:T9SS type A sorting domain-containing protein [Draconibacterium halophilum]QIA08725.1 T9SS type A sorting domain-containing protein [Draconibacterium halophilum]